MAFTQAALIWFNETGHFYRRFIMSLEVNMNSKQTKRPNPKYALEFKQDAAKLVNEKGYGHQQAADHLGISLSAMGRWVKAERTPKVAPVTKAAAVNLMDHSELVSGCSGKTNNCRWSVES